jgi:phosphoglycolate phosphatase
VPAIADTMVLFDWNGTVVVDADRARAALNAVLARRGLPVLGEAEFSVRFRLPMAPMLGEFGVAADQWREAEQEWNAEMADTHAHLRSGAAACLVRLSRAGVWLGIVSAASPAALRYDQRSLAVPSVWNAVDASVTDKFEVLLRHRPIRSNAFYVGDTADDMRYASAAGYTPVGVTDGYVEPRALTAAGAAFVIDSLDELPAIVEQPAPAQV